MEDIGPKAVKWPGYGVSPNYGHQAIEGEWMKADEYDRFLNDHSDYLLRVYLPRVSGAGAPFDQVSDNRRGMAGAMLDMYRQPDTQTSRKVDIYGGGGRYFP